jgi:hypothetical protein
MRLDRIGDAQFAALFQQQNGGRRELLAVRANRQLGRECVRDAPFQIRHSIGFGEEHVGASGHEHHAHERSRRVVGVEPDDLVHSLDVRLLGEGVLCDARIRQERVR